MKNLVANCPPYLLVLGGFCAAVALGCARLLTLLKDLS